jgi:hypothetical protein
MTKRHFWGWSSFAKRGELWHILGWPDPSVAGEKYYWDQIEQLAAEISSQLRKMRHAQENSTDAGNAVQIPLFVRRKLLLGYCFDTLARKRVQLRKQLSFMEMQVLPGENDDIKGQKSPGEFLRPYLEQADAVVLLANEYCGTWPEDEEAGFVSLQVRKAREHANTMLYVAQHPKPRSDPNGFLRRISQENSRRDRENQGCIIYWPRYQWVCESHKVGTRRA